MTMPILPVQDPTYTSHATTAVAMSMAVVEIGTWGASLYNVTIPSTVGVAITALMTPFLSIGLKQLGILSS